MVIVAGAGGAPSSSPTLPLVPLFPPRLIDAKMLESQPALKKDDEEVPFSRRAGGGGGGGPAAAFVEVFDGDAVCVVIRNVAVAAAGLSVVTIPPFQALRL